MTAEHRLTKWRRLILLRDVRTDPRSSYCVMCGLSMPTWRIQIHHIRPKSLYPEPEKAYALSNGVALCLICHMGIVHSGNSFKDLSEIHNWRVFVPTFDRHASLARNRRYNELNQHRV